jgi:tetratricopeptide (TPR) repeat protein
MLKIEPENYQALFYKANCFLFLEKIDSAEFCYKKVLNINPNYARANLNLAEVYLIKGDKQNAIKQYIDAIELFHKNNFNEEVILYSKRVLEIDPNNKISKKYLELYN